MTKFYVDSSGVYLGGFDGADPPAGAIEVPNAPVHGSEKWNAGAWVSPPLTVADYTVAVQAMLDAKARERHYDDIVSACSYAAASNPFQAEGIAFVSWRGACWALCYSLMAEVQAGTRPQPTIPQLVAAMPVFAP